MSNQYTSFSKTLNEICRKHPHIESCHSEYDGFNEKYGAPSYWIYTVPGYVSSETECGSIHVTTVKEARELIATIEKGEFINGSSVPLRRIIYASDCSPCECCEELVCPVCLDHYADCPCPGPDD